MTVNNKISQFLKKKGISQTALSLKTGISEAELSQVVTGRRKTIWIRRAIAKGLRMRFSKLWPQDGCSLPVERIKELKALGLSDAEIGPKVKLSQSWVVILRKRYGPGSAMKI